MAKLSNRAMRNLSSAGKFTVGTADADCLYARYLDFGKVENAIFSD